jgi:hypothetical protein
VIEKKISATVPAKQDWARPELRRLQAGSAESRDGQTRDGGAGFQGS